MQQIYFFISGAIHLLKTTSPAAGAMEKLFWQRPPGFPGRAPGRVLGCRSQTPGNDPLGILHLISRG